MVSGTLLSGVVSVLIATSAMYSTPPVMSVYAVTVAV
ncbi:Uncharacterised protein [uncultured archaeon]|nr:Uncharacterised protein [uncultured archaeon]